MPYVDKDQRALIWDEDNETVDTTFIHKIGDLNYAMTEMCKVWAERKGHSYTTYNEIVGVLECCKLEFYRRMVSEYEDEKIIQNGDVY
jgi:hypothetical protein